MRENRKWLFWLLALVMLLEIVAYLERDSHRANIPYNLWKIHLASYEAAKPFRYIYVDPLFRNHLLGKTRAEIDAWFPNLRKSTAEEEKQHYEAGLLKDYPGSQIYWSGWSNAFIFRDDHLVDIRVCKG